MNLTKVAYFAKSLIRFLLFISLIVIWYIWYFVGAFDQFRTKAITTVVRNEESEHLVSPTILICSNTAFKPSMAKEFDGPLRYLFWHRQESPQIKNLFKNQSVPNVFHNLSYTHDLTFSIMNHFVLKPGTTYFDFGNITAGLYKTGLFELKIIPTVWLGTCHIIDVLECTGNCHYWTFDISYNENLDTVDIPKSFSVYITSKNGWIGIVNSFLDTAESPILKFNTVSSGIELPLSVEVNLVENLRQYSKVDDFNSDWCKKSLIKDMINHFKKTCSIACIPVQFSALVKGYKNLMCIIILIMTVNHKLFLKLLHTQFMFHFLSIWQNLEYPLNFSNLSLIRYSCLFEL